MLKLGVGRKISFVPGIGINVITPMGAAALWYLQGGIPAANCMAAYRSISTPGSPWGAGPASYAASKVNLAQTETYDLTEGNAPTWNVATGWTFADTQYLICGYRTNEKTSCLVQFGAGVIGSGDHIVLGQNSANKFILWRERSGSVRSYYFNNKTASVSPRVGSGNLAMTPAKGYYDGLPEAVLGVGVGLSTLDLWFGGCNNPPYSTWARCQIYSVALYEATLSDLQILAVKTAMLAL